MNMISVTLPDGSVREVAPGTTPADIAAAIGPGLAKAAIAARVDGELRDIGRPLDHDVQLALVTARDEADALELARHDFAHVLAEAVQALFPGTQITFGPATDDGFYYDVMAPASRDPFSMDDLPAIEEKMREIIRADKKFAEFLKTPIVGSDQRKATLEKIVKGRVSDLVFRFIMVLANHGRASRIADVSDAFDSLMQERLGRIEVDMYTVDGKASDEVIATVKARVKEAFAKDAVLHQYSDASMIGGVKLRIGDQLIDGSVATQLRNMREVVSNRGTVKIRSRVGDFLA